MLHLGPGHIPVFLKLRIRLFILGYRQNRTFKSLIHWSIIRQIHSSSTTWSFSWSPKGYSQSLDSSPVHCKDTYGDKLPLRIYCLVNFHSYWFSNEFLGLIICLLFIYFVWAGWNITCSKLTLTCSRSPMRREGGTTLTSLTKACAIAIRRFSLLLPFGYAFIVKNKKQLFIL